MKENEKIAHHLHIPVQSCNDDILKAMVRPFTISWYKDRISYIHRQIPDISISTDLIVGFPTENEDRFADTLDHLKQISVSFIHVFPYSRKAGTVADHMKGHVDPKIKKQRVKDVMELEKPLTLNYRRSLIGKKVKLLVEKNENGRSYGYCREYVYITVDQMLKIGELYDVIIDDVSEEEVSGHVA